MCQILNYPGISKLLLDDSVLFCLCYCCYLVFAEKYFGNYFIMGGERFETNQQDVYLFGENDDLNFLGSKPVPVSIKLHSTNLLFCCFIIVVIVFIFGCLFCSFTRLLKQVINRFSFGMDGENCLYSGCDPIYG